MSDLSFSSISNKKNELSCNLLSVFFHFCFSIFSHPLYFSYFIFFSPYLLKLLSFLSPLFITTALLLVALLTFTPNLVLEKGSSTTSSSDLSDSESKLGFMLSILQTFLAWFLSESDEDDKEIGLVDEFEAYLVMFQASICEVFEPKSVENDSSEGTEAAASEFSRDEEREDFFPVEEASFNLDGNPVEKVDKEPVVEVKSLESLFQENAESEDVSCPKENREAKTLVLESNKVEESKDKWPLRSGSKVIYASKVSSNSDGEHALGAAVKVKSQRLEANPWSPQSFSGKGVGNNEAVCSNLGSFGSMRVEKEWRRTLACKLFEERHNASEGMDMLWETYEAESNKGNTKKGKKSEVESSEDEEEEEEEEEMEGKLCCLQALKFSTGKMNLGMGRPSNLLKFSKALKGIGWLHRHGRKSNH